MQYSPDMIVEYAKRCNDFILEEQVSLLANLKLSELIDNNNPYYFHHDTKTAEEIIKELVNAYISSSEETMFGDWLEGLAIYINQKVYSGWKSGIKGIDLEFDNNGKRYIVSIKSGPNWGNSSQISKMVSDFKSAQKTLRTSNSKMDIVWVNGCCYGKDNNPYKEEGYFKYCGQKFWEFIGGDENIYTDIIEPLGYKAKEKNEEYAEKHTQMINRFTKEFLELFCSNDGKINWKELVHYNSGNK